MSVNTSRSTKEEPSTETVDESPSASGRRNLSQVVNRALLFGTTWVAMFMMFTNPAAAQPCDTAIATTANNATTFLTAIGPLVGIANAGYNMTKAAGTNKPDKKKQAKENIKSSLLYGFAVGMLMGIAKIIINWTGVTGSCI